MASDPHNSISYPYHARNIPYTSPSSPLQTLDICLPRPLSSSDPTSTIWIIYIHGGAWRDPLLTSHQFDPALRILLSPLSQPTPTSGLGRAKALTHIAGFATLNYRLSSYPSHPTHPSDPTDESRNVRHPAHVEDVRAALEWLAGEYKVGALGGWGWVVVGHSCGAMMGLQLLHQLRDIDLGIERDMDGVAGGLSMPLGVVGLEGIYDLEAFVRNHEEKVYREIVTNAFGDEEGWREASPAVMGGFGREIWREGRVVVLGHSGEDELVEREQVERMVGRLVGEEWEEERGERRLLVVKLWGKHDEIWEEGTQVADAIGAAVLDLADQNIPFKQ
ncbi:alpha/beta-hydrolase [Patellaria atrata CBS 101060]|uniref:Kynurenine formamidase n=1 Tax=Patellaria atrata CBS 101060 TaxID=1346257 RepID=A0A9P4SGI1_9PEZI|nr:alpha/beta-hydrolase [Patellaria atrata CBS 101060]